MEFGPCRVLQIAVPVMRSALCRGAVRGAAGAVALSHSPWPDINDGVRLMRNCWVQEIVRAFYYGWYHQYVGPLPPITKGEITIPDGPGLGISLNDEVVERYRQPTR